jgi:hypothetical protein
MNTAKKLPTDRIEFLKKHLDSISLTILLCRKKETQCWQLRQVGFGEGITEASLTPVFLQRGCIESQTIFFSLIHKRVVYLSIRTPDHWLSEKASNHCGRPVL